ncbi:MAG: tetratricopeptide repeat protein, partial [Nitrospinae bacterium]|nr:tetratricopeptide repeat protein [Nitrospinota bacterium]
MHSSRIFGVTCFTLLLVGICFNSFSAFGQDEFDIPGENAKKNFTREIFTLSRQGDYPQAIRLAEQEVAKREKTYGLEDPYVAKAIQTLATLHLQVGNYAKAEPLLQRTFDIRKN